jgi:seryl-tRNA synthetase
MQKVENLVKAQNLLAQALAISQKVLSNDKSIMEARIHMRQALVRLEATTKNEVRRKQKDTMNAYQTWWKDIVSNVGQGAHAPQAKMSQEAAMRTLKELDKMMSVNKSKLDTLEAEVEAKVSTDTSVLND